MSRDNASTRDHFDHVPFVRMCLRNLVIVWGNYLIIEVAGIPLHIRGASGALDVKSIN